jgi:hypothetical protein
LSEGGKYTELAFNYEDGLILTAYADEHGLFWLVNPGKVVATGLTMHGASALNEQPLPNTHLETPSIIPLDNKLSFVTKDGCFTYNYNSRLLEKDEALIAKIGTINRHFNDNVGNIWIYNGKVWRRLDKQGELTIYPYLSLYPDVKQIFSRSANDNNIYFLTDNNQLYSYQAAKDQNEVYQSSVFYKQLFALSEYSGFRDKVKLSYDENYLRAELAQPDYLGLLKVEYQYYLEGMDEKWSDWSSSTKIELNFLPEGEYTLKVRSRDVFGREQNMSPILLDVNPPYWRTTWFYLLEVLFFASLVLISSKLNQSKAQNRFLTEGLTILTIVMIIETVQSVAGSFFSMNSPFFDFIINLCIALIIFPMENMLKNMIKSGKMLVKMKKKQEEI